jgi:hypothetical protein
MRLDQDERGSRCQVAPGPLEGMDHALNRDSSKRPAEEHDVERAATNAKLLGRTKAEGDVCEAAGRGEPSRRSHSLSVWFDGDHLGSEARELAGEPAISRSDLEDPPTAERDEPLDETYLHAGRRIVGAVLDLPRHERMLAKRSRPRFAMLLQRRSRCARSGSGPRLFVKGFCFQNASVSYLARTKGGAR